MALATANHQSNLTGRLEELERRNQLLEAEVQRLRVYKDYAYTDALTEIPNRRFYYERMLQEIARSRRGAHPLTLAMIDLDFFKEINQNVGHRGGDQVLKFFSQFIRANLRQEDVLCVLGGLVNFDTGVRVEDEWEFAKGAAAAPEERYQVRPIAQLAVDAGFASRQEAEAAGVRVGTPVVYLPRSIELAAGRVAGTAVDDRAGCVALIALAEARQGKPGPNLHLVWSVQEEHNLRGVLPAATTLGPDIAIAIDALLACDTPEVADRGDVELGGGPTMSMFSFHGRGTLNGVIPHPALVRLMEAAATRAAVPLQRSAHSGLLTDLSYIQFAGALGVACLDLGVPVRYSHSALEVVDPRDIVGLVALLDAALDGIGPDLELIRSP